MTSKRQKIHSFSAFPQVRAAEPQVITDPIEDDLDEPAACPGQAVPPSREAALLSN